MDFRDTQCTWCAMKTGPLEACTGCPRYRAGELGEDIVLDSRAFCSVCIHENDPELEVFCETNRHLQQDSEEPFDCYRYCLRTDTGRPKETHVVTAFLTHRGKVCLFRRSGNVRTYQGRWAGVSGYLEGEPGEHVAVEIQEETGLTPYEYTIKRRGRQLPIPDEEHACIWCVHPFLCEVQDPSRITLDRENTEYRWVRPEEIRAMETVPGLWEAWERVSPQAVREGVSAFAEELRADRESGARQLAFKSLDFLEKMVASSNAALSAVLMDDLQHACEVIGAARPSMAIIPTTLELLLRDLRPVAALGADVGQSLKQAAGIIGRHLKDMASAMDRAIAHLEGVVPGNATVLMHSYSSSLIHALGMLKKKGCSVVVTESRPGFEGRVTAQVAADMGLKVRLVPDACAAHELKQADVVLMGVDSIEQDGSVINKAGSALISMAAHALGVKVYFVGELRKICIDRQQVDLEAYDPGEVWSDPPPRVEVINLYFDRTAPKFITAIAMETGLVEPYQIRKIARSMIPFSA
ncbi:MAG: NUDIX domain-containing protein [Desulfomonilia bacterium]|jgi:ribose 1,5-bisphosphate isomerase